MIPCLRLLILHCTIYIHFSVPSNVDVPFRGRISFVPNTNLNNVNILLIKYIPLTVNINFIFTALKFNMF